MNIPKIGFGNGFMIKSSKTKISSAILYPVDISTGMPIISQKKVLWEKKSKPSPRKV